MLEVGKNGSLCMSKTMGKKFLTRQSAPNVFEHVASIYAMLPEHLKTKDHLLSGYAEGYDIGFSKSIDVDSDFDFDLVEFLMKEKFK